MKKLFIYTFVFCLLSAACSKERPEVSGAPAESVFEEVADALSYKEDKAYFWSDCADLPKNIASCTRYVCALETDLFEDTLYTVFAVRGEKDGKCVFVQGLQLSGRREETLHCFLNKTQRENLGAYYRALIEAEQQGLSAQDLPPDLIEILVSQNVCAAPQITEEEIILPDGTAVTVEESDSADESYHPR